MRVHGATLKRSCLPGICVRHYACRKILGVTVAQPKTCPMVGENAYNALEVGNWGVRMTETCLGGCFLPPKPPMPSRKFWVTQPRHPGFFHMRNSRHSYFYSVTQEPRSCQLYTFVYNANKQMKYSSTSVVFQICKYQQSIQWYSEGMYLVTWSFDRMFVCKVTVNLKHFFRNDLAYFGAR